MSPRSFVLLGCLAASVAACSQALAIWIVQGSTVETLRFGVSRSTGDTVAVPVHALSVAECYVPDTIPDRVYWTLEHGTRGRLPKLRGIRYGQPPSGYLSIVGPRPLKRDACFYARLQASASTYPNDVTTFLTDSLGGVREIRGDSLESLRLLGSEPARLTDSVRSRLVIADMASVAMHARHIFVAHGFSVSGVTSDRITTEVLKLGSRWEDRVVAERIDCGRWVDGSNRVNLPLSRDSADGYGHLLVSIQAQLRAQSTGTLVVLDAHVRLNPPWFEHGDRPMMHCELEALFVTKLLEEVATRIRDAGGA